MAPSPLRKGPSAAAAVGIFATVKEDQPLTFIPLVEFTDIISADMHEIWEVKPFISFPCIGAGCPACAAGHQAVYKSFMPILVKDETDPKILPMKISIERAIGEINEAIGSIKGKVMRLKRTGTGMSTRYAVTPLGKEMDVSTVKEMSVEDHIRVLTAKEIIEKLKTAGMIDGEAEPVTEEKASKAEKKPAPKPASGEGSIWDEE